jgi:hypothetical protein
MGQEAVGVECARLFLLRSAASGCAHAFGREEWSLLRPLPRAHARGYSISPTSRAGRSGYTSFVWCATWPETLAPLGTSSARRFHRHTRGRPFDFAQGRPCTTRTTRPETNPGGVWARRGIELNARNFPGPVTSATVSWRAYAGVLRELRCEFYRGRFEIRLFSRSDTR